MIKVLLVNEQRLFNEALESLLSTEVDIHVVGMSTGQETMKQIEEKKPDVILLDLHMSSVDGIEATINIEDNYPHIKVIYLTTFSKRELVVAGIFADANGFLLKNIDSDSLVQSIRQTYNNQTVTLGQSVKNLIQKVVEFKDYQHEVLKERLENNNIYLS